MDFRQTVQPNSSRPTGAAPTAPEKEGPTGIKSMFPNPGKSRSKWLNILNVVVLFGVAALVIAIAFIFARSNGDNEYKYVDTAKYQAVFLNNGQVYFGSVASMNNKYVQLTNIYYLTQSSSATGTAATEANSNYTLVKLGCQQIHNPTDQMLINRDQVTFWENLENDGKVVKSIKEFIKQNPKGPDCSQVSTQTQASSTGAAQGGTATTKP